MRVAYLVSQYPAPSHTFIRREVWALRDHGVDLQTFSVRRPSRDQVLSEEDRQAYAETFYVLPVNPVRLLTAHIGALFGNPIAYFRTFYFAQRHRAAGMHALIWAIFYFAEAIVLAAELRRRGIDHVHNHFANAGADIGLFATRYLSISWSLSIHGTSDLSHPAITLLPGKVAHAKLVAFVSWFGRAQAMRVCDPAHWYKFVIVRCGLELEKLPDDVGMRQDPGARVLCVARLSPEKGHVGLLRAVGALCRDGKDLTLTLIGEGPCRGNVEREIAKLDLKSRVQLLGHQSEAAVRDEMARSDVLVLASFMEGLPVVLIEAMALGVPVIAPSVAGIPELVEHRSQGLLYSPGRWDQLEDALRELIDDPEARARYGRDGRRKVRAEYDIRTTVEPLLPLFKGEHKERASGCDQSAIGEQHMASDV